MYSPTVPQPTLRLRPLGLGDILEEAFEIYRRHFGLLLALAIVPAAIPLLLLAPVGVSMLALGAPNPTPDLGRILGLVAVVVLVALALVPFNAGLVPRAAIWAALGQPVSPGAVVGAVARRYWGLMGVVLATFAVLYLLFITVIGIPFAFWIFFRWWLAVPALLTEGVGPGRALARSWDLTRGSFWRVFGIVLLVGLLTAVVAIVLELVGIGVVALLPALPAAARAILRAIVQVLATALVTPVDLLTAMLLYFDLRVRKERLDLDLQAGQAGQS